MHYHNFNVLPHTFSVSLAWFGGYLLRVTTFYRQIYKKMYIDIFLKEMTVNSPQTMLN